MSDTVAVTVGSDLVKPIVEAKIQAAIVSALGRPEQLIEEAVRTVMNRKVDAQGNPSDSYYSKPYIEWLASEALRSAVKVAVTNWVALNQSKIESQISKELKMRSDTFAKAFVNGFSDGMKSSWQTKFEITFSPEKS